MSSQRLLTAFSMTAREFLRRRGMLALMVGVPAAGFLLVFLALPDAPAAVDAVENGVKVRLTITQTELFGGFSSLIYVGLMAAVTGLYLMRSALEADRRLMISGYSAFELVCSRVIVILAVDLALTVVLVGMMLPFLTPRQLPAYVLAVYWAAVLYSFYGGLIGTLVRNELGGIIAILFFVNIDIGYLQVPGYSTILDEWWAQLLPGYFPAQLAIDAAFTARLEWLAASFWSVPHAIVIAGVMLAGYQRATNVHTFLPEQGQRRPVRRLIIALIGVLAVVGGAVSYVQYQTQPPTIETSGRVRAPEARVVSVVSGRIREMLVEEGQDVVANQIVAWAEDHLTGSTAPLRAPMDGTVTSVTSKAGENVIQGSVVALIHRLDQMEVRLEVEETAVTEVRVGQRVELQFASLGETVVSTVGEIGHQPLPPGPGATENERRVRKYAVTVPLPRVNERLRLGMAVSATVFL